ncbi:hypothetical protein [Streptomyces sp. CB03238]|uniref:hypothetical protein n=1 Tax=Streptomyces sp. CB03238 TaxID=1907777 RepID=UPI001F4F027D|nr:hypothetical protein [Streptomyces sp. CB03238]
MLASGIYACDYGGERYWSTDVKGYHFPPLPSGSGEYWTLQKPAHPRTTSAGLDRGTEWC